MFDTVWLVYWFKKFKAPNIFNPKKLRVNKIIESKKMFGPIGNWMKYLIVTRSSTILRPPYQLQLYNLWQHMPYGNHGQGKLTIHTATHYIYRPCSRIKSAYSTFSPDILSPFYRIGSDLAVLCSAQLREASYYHLLCGFSCWLLFHKLSR